MSKASLSEKRDLLEKEIQIKELLSKLNAYGENKLDQQNFKKRRRDIIYNLNSKNRTPRDDTLKKYDIKYSLSCDHLHYGDYFPGWFLHYNRYK
jgi:hypothetical protein